MDLLRHIERRCADAPDRLVLVEHSGGDRRPALSAALLLERVESLAGELVARGAKPGQVVGVCMGKSIEHVVAMLAVLRVGAGYLPIHPQYSPGQLHYITRLARPPVVLLDGAALLRLAAFKTDQPVGFRGLVYTGEELRPIHGTVLERMSGEMTVDVLPIGQPRRGGGRHRPVPEHNPVDEDLAAVLFTSGSGGVPKGVMISRGDLRERTLAEIETFGITSDDRLLSVLPFTFDVGLNQLLAALVSGATLVLMGGRAPSEMCAAVSAHGITGVSGIPAVWRDLLYYDDTEARRCLNRLRYITLSGGDLPEEHLVRLREFGARTEIYKTYGQTEAFRATVLKPRDFERKMLSVGRPVPGTEVLVVNESGGMAAPGEEGEVVFRGTGAMLGYLGDPAGAGEKIRPHPLGSRTDHVQHSVIYTGDIGKVDREGFLYLLGRRDRMVRIGEHRVYPEEVESEIAAHPRVAEVAVAGVRTRRAGAELCAEVVLRAGADLSQTALGQFLSDRLPAWMIPGRIVFVAALPRTPSGKVRYAVIEAKYGDRR